MTTEGRQSRQLGGAADPNTFFVGQVHTDSTHINTDATVNDGDVDAWPRNS